MFLLCELQLVPPNLITADTLHFIFKLGHFLEWEGTIAHDLSKWKRDHETGELNSYLWWLHHNNKTHSDTTVKQFLAEAEGNNKKRLEKISNTPTNVIDINLILSKTLPNIRQFYAVADIIRTSKL